MLREIIEALSAGYIMEAQAASQLAEIAYLVRSGKIKLTKEAFDDTILLLQSICLASSWSAPRTFARTIRKTEFERIDNV